MEREADLLAGLRQQYKEKLADYSDHEILKAWYQYMGKGEQRWFETILKENRLDDAARAKK